MMMSGIVHSAAHDGEEVATNDMNSPVDDFPAILEKITSGFSRIPERVAQRIGNLICYNRSGRRTPIFWCFNSYAEPGLFAHHLGPDQPLYAMRSFHEIVEERSRRLIYRPRLAKIYADEIMKIHTGGNIVIGGNCQSAAIIEIVAHEIISISGNVPLVMMLEFDPKKPYPGSLLMMFGDKSEEFNPFLRDTNPIQQWEGCHRNFSWGIVRGTHGSYFFEPAVFDLVDFVTQAIKEFEDRGDLVGGEKSLSGRTGC